MSFEAPSNYKEPHEPLDQEAQEPFDSNIEQHKSDFLMKFFRYQADILPVAIFCSLSIADFAVFFFIENHWIVIAWMLAGLFPKACICAWNHHHQHVNIFRQKFLNRAIEVIYSLHTGITTNVWVLHHNLGHHLNYLDQSKDESAWKRPDGTVMGVMEYTMTIALTGYPRAHGVGKKHPRYVPALIGMEIFVASLLVGLFFINWFNALFVFLIPMVWGLVVTCWATYYHHSGLETDDHHEASHNITHRWYNILTGNLGYHTAHHSKMALHWSRLPELHKQISGKIPDELYVTPCIPFCWFKG